MKFTCSREELVHAIQIVQKAVSSKSNISISPVFGGIFIRATEGSIELQATNIEINISASLDATVEEAGVAVLSARFFSEIVRKMPGDVITITTNNKENNAILKAGNSSCTLVTLNADDFPTFKPLAGINTFVVKDVVFKDLIKKTVFACAQDDTRPIFSSVCLEFGSDTVSMAATNTHRLAFKKDKVDPVASPITMLVPGKMLKEVSTILSDDLPTDITISYERNRICLSFDRVFLISRLVEGQFPDYKRVIPRSFNTNVLVDTKELADAVSRVSLIARESDYNVIKFDFEDDKIHIYSSNPDVGASDEYVNCSIEGDPIYVAINSNYVSDILKNIYTEKTEISLNQTLTPIRIRPEGSEDYIYIVTPVRR
ncbi:MAG: DNA polymerase III subunit beta [Selenomonadales bacterium]|nr:DNA polymerase III subunit beta [Selenomonadales bacterium]